MEEEAGKLETEGEMETTWRVGQEESVKHFEEETAKESGSLTVDRIGRVIRGTGVILNQSERTGHVATFDSQGTLHAGSYNYKKHAEITLLYDQSHFAVAQKKCVFIYDCDGVELHCLRSRVEQHVWNPLVVSYASSSVPISIHLHVERTWGKEFRLILGQ